MMTRLCCIVTGCLSIAVMATACSSDDATNSDPQGSGSAVSDGGLSGSAWSTGGNSATGGTSVAGGTATSGGNLVSGGAGGTVSATGGLGGSGGEGAACIDACGLYGSPCCFESGGCIPPTSSCVVDVLATSVSVIYEYTDLEREVASISQDVLLSFADTDVAWVAVGPSPAARLEVHLTSEASAAYGAALESVDLHPFRVSCRGQELFVGVFYLVYGAAAIDTPVFHVARDEEDEDLVVLRLGAFQGAWALPGATGPEGTRERIDRAELRAVFCQRGALRELDTE